MSVVTISVTIEVPDNATVRVDTPVAAPPVVLPPLDEPPFPGMEVARQPAPADRCPTHQLPWKTVPAGISASTGNAYDSFRACPERGCKERPRR